MTKLLFELLRLYVPHAPHTMGERAAALESLRLVDADGQVRAMVLTLSRPADWSAMARVWQGVQADLELPAPAIAVSGADGFQLWFSLAEPVPAAQAAVFLDALRERYLAEVRIERVASMPMLDAASPPNVRHAAVVPAPVPTSEAGGDHWSAFVAPDLAPVFAQEPWLDTPPSPEGQAELLSRLKCITAADFQRALEQLRPPTRVAVRSATHEGSVDAKEVHSTLAGEYLDSRRFLLDVMNDRSVALALRIEAAKALLLGGPPDRVD